MAGTIKIPCWRYSANGPILVTSQDALDALGPEWVDSPAKVVLPSAPAVADGPFPSAAGASPAGAMPVGDALTPPAPKTKGRWKKDRP